MYKKNKSKLLGPPTFFSFTLFDYLVCVYIVWQMNNFAGNLELNFARKGLVFVQKLYYC